MNPAPNIMVAISDHGFGHLVQVAPLINRLRQDWPEARIKIHTAHPKPLIASRIDGPFEHLVGSPDPGMAMHHALDLDAATSYQAYRKLFQAWPARLEQACQDLQGIDLVIADVPFLILAAAQRLGIPNLAVCSLNWRDIFLHYCGDMPEAQTWGSRMAECYQGAELFLQPAPSMPMDWLQNRLPIGPLVALGKRRPQELRERLGVGEDQRILLASLGGISTKLGLEHWASGGGIHYLVAANGSPLPAGFSDLGSLNWPFPDLMASVDALLTKPGYGMFSEAACLGLPVLFVGRGDWPEEPWLVEWLVERDRALEIPRASLNNGDFAEPLERLLNLPRPQPPEPSGADEGAAAVRRLL
jgi:hypothetical protein